MSSSSSTTSGGAPPPLGGATPAGRVLGPALDKIVKNAAWRKHTTLVAACKSALDLLSAVSDPVSDPDSPISTLPSAAASATLRPLSAALDASSPKLADPALHCALALFSRDLFIGPITSVSPDTADSTDSLIPLLLANVSACGSNNGDESLEIISLRVLVAAVRSPAAAIGGEALVHIVKSCYNVYLGSSSSLSQICAKASLAMIVTIVFARAEENNMLATAHVVSAADLLDISDRSLNDSNLVQAAQNFINEAIEGGGSSRTVEEGNASKGEISGIREDALFLFKNLCKFSMKFATPDNPEDPLLLRGKVLSLELLKMVIDNAGSIWRTNDKFLGAIKQYLCLSLLKNSALSVMSIFQLLCSIFTGLLSKFRSGLKEEIGIFFPMLVLRVIENVLQPSFLQKMTVLNLLEKICQDPQIIIDIFVNYDCDVDAPNIFERIVNGLLKTALGVPPGSVTTLSPTQDISFRNESVKCLASIVKSMGTWMDQQLHIGNYSHKVNDVQDSVENYSSANGDDTTGVDYDIHSDNNSNAVTLEQRRAFKLEFQKGISIFNRKPSKGIEFLINTKKIGSSPEEVASFLRNTAGLNETVIGDYLGEREGFPLKVMHAYVDSMNFEGMSFGDAIRFFLRGFRLPGEAQKIDRIMEKFAARYCKCNPGSFSSADTAYVLSYSVILLNTDAHNSMVKDKMSKTDFIRNNRGINDGKDLPEDFLGSLYDDILNNEIKMKADSSAQQNKQANSLNKLLGLDTILNLVNWKQSEEKAIGTSDMLIRNIQEQFKAKSVKSESIYYTISDTAILRFMMEACWAPMMAAFSVTLDQSEDSLATSYSLQGFRNAVHVTSVMCMQTQRDAFVTSVAKFTYLHCVADMKQKNVEAVKAIISIAIVDGNYLQESWEHILTCLSRFEQLHLLGEGAPIDASFFTISVTEAEERSQKSPAVTSLKKKTNSLQNPAVMAVVRGGSYDSTALGVNASGLVTPEQINNFISNLNLLDQIGTFELNHIFAHSQRLNSEAIVAFVKALCKVSMAELQSPTDPRVFSLTKIVEIAHYNMNRIRLVWSRIWNVLSDYFVSVGLSENLSVAIFVMDSLRQLAMKFLEREELANYNFQNEFLRPFVVVMQESSSAEIRELIVRCVSQMVLSRVSNVKSGWKSVFMVFTTAAADDRKNIVLLAFETMEKIVREYFVYITETETTTFTDCVKCLITFTNSKFNNDASLNAIAFLRYCAVKLAEGELVCSDDSTGSYSANGDAADVSSLSDNDDHINFWVPLLSGLSKLTSDPRPSIRKGAVQVLFDILKDHGHLFSRKFWTNIFVSIIHPVFSNVLYRKENQFPHNFAKLDDDFWHPESDPVAVQCLMDLYLKFVDVLRSQLKDVIAIITSFIRSPYHKSATTGVNAFLQLIGNVGDRLSYSEWEEILLHLKQVAIMTLPELSRIVLIMNNIEIPESSQAYSNTEQYSDQGYISTEEEDSNMETASYAVVRMKGHIAVELLIMQAVIKLYEAHKKLLSTDNISILLDILYCIALHAGEVRNETTLQLKLKKTCSLLEVTDPPVVHFENEAYQNYLKFLEALLKDKPLPSEEIGVEGRLVDASEKILQIYLDCASYPSSQQRTNTPTIHWMLPLGSAKKEELAARTNLVVLAVQVLSSLETNSFRRNLPRFLPLLINLIRCEHSSGAVQRALFDIFHSSIGPIILS